MLDLNCIGSNMNLDEPRGGASPSRRGRRLSGGFVRHVSRECAPAGARSAGRKTWRKCRVIGAMAARAASWEERYDDEISAAFERRRGAPGNAGRGLRR